MSWENIPQQINPVIFQIGNFKILWYSISYILAFATIYLLLKNKVEKNKEFAIKLFKDKKPFDKIELLFVFCLIGLFIGAKLGFILFYNLPEFLENPLSSITPFTNGKFTGFSGLSFHGALIGIVAAGLLFCKKEKLSFIKLANFIIVTIPLGYFWGRLGNFANGELYGRMTKNPIGMCFPRAGDCIIGNRHPSQLYEAFGEGLLLFVLLIYVNKTKFGKRNLFSIWLIAYGSIRFLIEFFREPDIHLGTIFLFFSTGQILCFFMTMLGFILIVYPKKTKTRF